jgi:uncharacterized delta-60 repeat protein
VKRLAWVTVLVALLGTATSSEAGAPGALDRGFGRDGVATLSDPFLEFRPAFSGLQPGGGVVLGATATVPGSTAGPGLVVARFTPGGKLDRGFGDGGRVETGLTGGRAAVSADGGFVAAAATGDPFGGELELHRYTRAGALDPAFGSGGKAISPLPQAAYPTAIAVQPGGGVVLALSGGWVQRFTPSGTLDTGFGDGGQARFDGSDVTELAILPGGRIVVGGKLQAVVGPYKLLVARLLPDGSPDLGFGGVGLGRVADDSAGARTLHSLGLGRGGRIAAVGSSCTVGGGFACRGTLWQFPPDGGEGPGRKVTHPHVSGALGAAGLAFDSKGGIVVAGTGGLAASERFVFVARARPDGRLGRGFGDRGVTVFRGREAAGKPLVLDDGRIVVAMRERLGTGDPAVLRVVRLWGGYDRRPPVIAVAVSCAGRRAVARLRIRDRSRLARVSVKLHGRRVRVKARRDQRLTLRRSGRLRVLAVDRAGNRAVRYARVPRCPVSA